MEEDRERKAKYEARLEEMRKREARGDDFTSNPAAAAAAATNNPAVEGEGDASAPQAKDCGEEESVEERTVSDYMKEAREALRRMEESRHPGSRPASDDGASRPWHSSGSVDREGDRETKSIMERLKELEAQKAKLHRGLEREYMEKKEAGGTVGPAPGRTVGSRPPPPPVGGDPGEMRPRERLMEHMKAWTAKHETDLHQERSKLTEEKDQLSRDQEAQARRRKQGSLGEEREMQREQERRAFQARLRQSESELQQAREEENIRARDKLLHAEKRRIDAKTQQRQHDAAAERRRWEAEDTQREEERRQQTEFERRQTERDQRRRDAEKREWEARHGPTTGGGSVPSARGMATEMRQSRAQRESEDQRWEAFSKEPPVVIRMQDVPFPSEDALKGGGLSRENQKKVFKEWARRWHPDKFMQSFGGRLDEEAKEAIQDRVKATFQSIQASFQK